MDSVSLARRYELLGTLGRGGMGAVYLVRDRLMDRRVALKRVLLPTVKESSSGLSAGPGGGTAPTLADIAALPTVASTPADGLGPQGPEIVVIDRGRISRDRLQALRRALAGEFRLLASLRHPSIVSVLDYGFAPDGQPYFTMELLANAKSLSAACTDASLSIRVGLLLQILQALSYLHRRGVLHRDLKPGNILCIAVPASAGVRVKLVDFGLARLHKVLKEESSEISGTAGYIAPEVLQGRPVTAQADLYSFGVVAFELLTGRSLWKQETMTALFAAALSSEPSFESVNLPAPLLAVLRRLLAPEPEERFATAEAAAAALAAAIDIPLPGESGELRDCVLGSAELVGREAELALLDSALQKVRGGSGQLILVSGESGIGKSRLLDELRTLAMVAGASVLPGQARSDGTADLALFADALRRLCLDEPPPPAVASVLKGILFDLPGLLQREIADPPEIDAQAARGRLMAAISSALLAVKQPTLLLLEDLHWAGPDSIDLLRQLSAGLDRRPLLIVGSYRSDERPGLPEELPGGRVLPLARLGRADITRLSRSILGVSQATDQLLDWLMAQSEGNSFFITEALRAVAEEAGSLDAVDATALPHGVLTGGMDAVLRRRLAQVPGWAQPLLRLSAVAGRQLDVELLRGFAPELDDWLRLCLNAGVLEVHQPSWRFSHDKLRERLLADIPAAEQRLLHRQVGEAIEKSSPQPGPLAATLAFHFEQAEVLPKAATYAALAGENALRGGALAEAQSLLQKGRALQDRLGLPDGEKAHTQRMLAETLYGLSQLEASHAAVCEALQLLGRPFPSGKQATNQALLRCTGSLLWHRLVSRPTPPPTTSAERQRLLEEAWLHSLSIELCGHLGRMEGAVYSALHCANVGDLHPDMASHFPHQFGLLALLSMAAPVPLIGIRSLDEMMAPLPEISDARLRLFIMQRGGIVYYFRGEMRTAVFWLTQALALADEQGDSTAQRMLLTYLNWSTRFLGDHDAAQRHAERLAELSRPMRQTLYLETALLMQSAVHLVQDDLSAAGRCLDDGCFKTTGELGVFDGPLRALLLARQGRTAEAQWALDSCLQKLEQAPINVFFGVQSYAIPIEVALLLRERATGAAELSSSRLQCRQALRLLRRFALMSPLGWAALFLHEGQVAWLDGHPRLAAWWLRLAISRAERYQMQPTAALATCWLGRTQPGAASQRLIDQGLQRLHQYGARWDASNIEKWLPS